MSHPRRRLAFALSLGLFALAAVVPWHPQPEVRRASGIVLAVLLLWITGAAPLGVTALAIPVAATLAGVLPWTSAISTWGDPILFLFLGAFLLARALDKHGAFDRFSTGTWMRRWTQRGAGRLTLATLGVSGTISTLQNNTAVTAMLLPAVTRLARDCAAPALVLLALSYGSTFGGMATPVGTAPNFIGYAAMKKLDASVSFVSWLRVGIPVWIGTTLIGWAFLMAWRRSAATAALMVPIAAALGEQAGLSATQTIWLVALCASLGFALPVSTPPNALVYGTRLVPLRLMFTIGILVDLACLVWVVLCVRWFSN